jgi:OmpA-OmpF porin, OOP family
MTTTHHRLVAAAAVATLAATALSGCGSVLATPQSTPSCDWLEHTRPAPDAGRTVVLLDRSGSTHGSGAPDYTEALDHFLAAAVDTHDVVSIGTFDGSAASVRWTNENLVTDHGRENPELRRDDDNVAKRCLRTALSSAERTEAMLPGSDVMGALMMGGQVLGTSSGRKKLVIATDGLATTGCADLSHVVVGDYTVIDPIRRLCAQRAPRDHDLSGVAVTLVGIGHPATGRPQPSTLQLGWLASLWTTLCTGARAKHCDVRMTPIARGTDAASAGGGPEDPDVALPAPEHGIRQGDGSTRFQLDSQVLFTPNDSTVSRTGRASLVAIADSIRAEGATEVTVDGYTEAQATPDANATLARDRADAVRGVLAELGITNVRATGHADAAPDCTSTDRQCKRRVDIVAR